ncbi:hypothetical protein [Bradyrhizobium sp. NP1]|uniref:hypothetical protein n=1 Tax=Bradyrhizobium sp. NP1 TaxID=3049772 RepID=UPI0025A5BBE9|nr:hypothetical protein [Bradyrhizobium sp. NP1]WJR77996.1 hypothetical protein QOU61_35750 [Bradyrhizobium sp. NP1]
MAKAVLAIGIEPALADVSGMPGLTPQLIRDYINRQFDQLRALGYEVESCLIDLGETAEDVVTAALRSRRYDCVVIGAGLRLPPALLLLFEKVINLVHIHARDARICFNTNPGDTVEAVQRWVAP